MFLSSEPSEEGARRGRWGRPLCVCVCTTGGVGGVQNGVCLCSRVEWVYEFIYVDACVLCLFWELWLVCVLDRVKSSV